MTINEVVTLIMNGDISDRITSLHRFSLLKRCSDPPKIEPTYTLESSLHLDFKTDEQKVE
ncbi:hypothetical protein V2J09_003131 [Rumex salicifolius]